MRSSSHTMNSPRPRRSGGLATAVARVSTLWVAVTAAGLAPRSAVAADPPATSATGRGQPGGADVDRLIKQLGDDSDEVRVAAQAKLVDVGASAFPELRRAATSNPDPEVRSRAATVVVTVTDRDANQASPITLHMRDANRDQVLAALGQQAHAPVLGPPASTSVPDVGSTMSVDADHQPFWDVVGDICVKSHLCPVPSRRWGGPLRLLPTSRNGMAGSAHQVVGPYWFAVAGLARSSSVDLMGPIQSSMGFSIRFVAVAEPKLNLSQLAFVLKEVKDDAGQNLISLSLPRPPDLMYPGPQDSRFLLTTFLPDPNRPGGRIKVLRGDLVAVLAQDLHQFEVDDVLGTPHVTRPLAGDAPEVKVVAQASDVCRVTLRCSRAGFTADRVLASQVALFDGQGRPLSDVTGSVDVSDPAFFSINRTFNRRGDAMPGEQVGVATRLVWTVPGHFKTTTMPVTFADLPLP